MKSTPFVFSILCATGLALLPNANAGMFSINPDAADARVQTSSGAPVVDDAGDYACRIGEYFAPGGSCYVVPFQLPALTGGDTAFTAASLQFQLFTNAMGVGQANADLYALGVRATSTPLATDYYNGATPDTGTGHVLIQQNFLTPATPVRVDANNGFVTTSATANTTLLSYLNLVDPAGINAGQFVFFRVSYDADSPIPNGNNYYELLTQNAGGQNEKPFLNLTGGTVAAPEPSTFVLMGLGGVALVAYRARRRQA